MRLVGSAGSAANRSELLPAIGKRAECFHSVTDLAAAGIDPCHPVILTARYDQAERCAAIGDTRQAAKLLAPVLDRTLLAHGLPRPGRGPSAADPRPRPGRAPGHHRSLSGLRPERSLPGHRRLSHRAVITGPAPAAQGHSQAAADLAERSRASALGSSSSPVRHARCRATCIELVSSGQRVKSLLPCAANADHAAEPPGAVLAWAFTTTMDHCCRRGSNDVPSLRLAPRAGADFGLRGGRGGLMGHAGKGRRAPAEDGRFNGKPPDGASV